MRAETASGPRVLVASVTVVFDGLASPEELAARLLALDSVSTVRIHTHGSPSACRVDVPGDDYEDAVARAADAVVSVATDLGLEADVLSVALATDDEREEVFRR